MTGRASAIAVLVGAAALVIACANGNSDTNVNALGADAGDTPTNTGETVPGDDDDETSSSGNPIGNPVSTNDAGAEGGVGNVTGDCANALASASWNFDTSDQGWTHAPSDGADQQASWPFDPWSRGTGGNGESCPNGQCWGAELNENYAQCSRGELVSPTVDLSACAGQNIQLQFTHIFDFWSGAYQGTQYYDGGIVELSSDGGATWSVPPGNYPSNLKILKAQGSSYTCVSAPYHADGKPGFIDSISQVATFSVAVPAAMLTKTVKIRFSTAAGVSTPEVSYARENTGAGWRIDDVKLVGGS